MKSYGRDRVQPQLQFLKINPATDAFNRKKRQRRERFSLSDANWESAGVRNLQIKFWLNGNR